MDYWQPRLLPVAPQVVFAGSVKLEAAHTRIDTLLALPEPREARHLY